MIGAKAFRPGLRFGGALVVSMGVLVSMGVAHAGCTTVSPTVTCTGGAGASISYNNGNAQSDGTHDATTYPTTITVSGGSGTASVVTLTVHTYTSTVGGVGASPGGNSSQSVGLLLVSPTGRALEVMRSTGTSSTAQSSLTFTIADSGAASFPDSNTVWSTGGTFKPTANPGTGTNENGAGATPPGVEPNYHTNNLGGTTTAPASFHSAAPNGTSTFASVFAGDSVNGTWSLFLADDYSRTGISFASWDIAITFSAASSPSTTTLTPNPTTPYTTSPGNSAVLTAQVTSGATGTVTFKDNGTSVTCSEGAQPRTLNGSAQATCTTTFSTEGIHPLNASYSGDSTFVISAGSANVYVQNHPSKSSTTYCNAGTITNDGNSASGFTHTSPYPSVIFVGGTGSTGLGTTVSTVSVQIPNFSSPDPNQARMVLMAPDGTHALDFWSGAGLNTGALAGVYHIQDGSPALPPPSGAGSAALSPGTYGPTSYFAATITPGPPAPAPQVPASFGEAAPIGSKTFLTSFSGAPTDGAWALFLYNNDGSAITFTGGWCLDITPASGFGTSVNVTSNPTPRANTGNFVTFTANVTSPGHGTVTTGNVTFTENGAPLVGTGTGVAAVSSGVATITTQMLPEGEHVITADYQDTGTTFAANFGTVSLREDKATSTPTLSGSTWSYCNAGGITRPAGTIAANAFGPAGPNPSNVFVTSLYGTISSVTVTLTNFHKKSPSQLESLLVGPNGASNPGTAQTFDFFTLAGGVTAFGPATLTFGDAFTRVPSNSLPAGNNGPANYNGSTTSSYTSSPFFTLPGAFQYAATHTSQSFTFNTGTLTGSGGGVFLNTIPDGTWSLYFNQLDIDTGNGAASWCMNFVENPVTVNVNKGHNGNASGHFTQGQQGAQFTVTVHNNGPGPTGDPDGAHPLTVTDTVAADFTPATLPTGTPWNCAAVVKTVTCTSDSVVAAGSDYPQLVIPVNVANGAGASDTNQVSVSGGGLASSTNSNIDTVTIDPAPVLAIAKSHSGTVTQGGTVAWNLQVTNTAATAAGATNGTVTVSDSFPAGYTLASFAGTGWACLGGGTGVATCTSTQVVAGAGGAFNLLTLTVNVPANSPTTITNTAKVFGGGDLGHNTLGNAATGSDSSITVIETTTTTGSNASANFSASDQLVTLSATVLASPVAVGAGSVTFTVKNGATTIGAPVTSGTVAAGAASASFTLPGGTPVGSYTIQAVYNAGTGFAGSSDSTHTLSVGQIAPVITWSNPADVTFGSALSGVQLNATASVPGTFVYTPPSGTVLPVGNAQTLSVQFTPTDTADFSNASKNVSINVTAASGPATLVITRTLARETGTNDVLVTLTLANTGGSPATGVQLTSGKIGAAVTTTSLPQSIPDVPAGGSQSITIRFAAASVGAPGSGAVLSYAGSYGGGSFGGSSRIVLP